jgi:5'-nucleotidase
MSKLRILIDQDAILADLLADWLALYNSKFDDALTKSDIHSWDVHKYVKPECGTAVYALPSAPGLYRNLKPIPGALAAVNSLLDDGHKVAIVTAHSEHPENTTEKMQWIYEHLPRLGHKNVFFAHLKSWIKGDVLIDDSPNNIISYRESWPDAKILSIAYAYNKSASHLCDVYAQDYTDTEKAWTEILTNIKKF